RGAGASAGSAGHAPGSAAWGSFALGGLGTTIGRRGLGGSVEGGRLGAGTDLGSRDLLGGRQTIGRHGGWGHSRSSSGAARHLWEGLGRGEAGFRRGRLERLGLGLLEQVRQRRQDDLGVIWRTGARLGRFLLAVARRGA